MIEMSCQRVGVILKFNPCLQVSILVYDLMEQWTVAGKGLLHFIIDIQYYNLDMRCLVLILAQIRCTARVRFQCQAGSDEIL